MFAHYAARLTAPLRPQKKPRAFLVTWVARQNPWIVNLLDPVVAEFVGVGLLKQLIECAIVAVLNRA